MAGRGSVCLPAFPLTWFKKGLDSCRPEEIWMVAMWRRTRSQTMEEGDKVGRENSLQDTLHLNHNLLSGPSYEESTQLKLQ